MIKEKLTSMERDLTLKEPLGEAKEKLWANIIDFVNDIWPSIQVIFKQIDLIALKTEAIEKVKRELGNRPREATRLIQFLNSKNKYQLQELEIEDRIATILHVKKLFTKKDLMHKLEEKSKGMEVAIDRFMAKFDKLKEKGLPNPLVINDKLMEQGDYNDKLRDVARQQVANSQVSGIPTGKVLYSAFENLFYLQHEVKHLFVNKPSFAKYTEADETYQRMLSI